MQGGLGINGYVITAVTSNSVTLRATVGGQDMIIPFDKNILPYTTLTPAGTTTRNKPTVTLTPRAQTLPPKK